MAEELASFCIHTGVAPSEYPHLTRAEREAFIRIANKRR